MSELGLASDLGVDELKLRVANRLSKAEVMTGILPTPVTLSNRLSRMARSIRRGDVEMAEKTATLFLRAEQKEVAAASATATFGESPSLGSQLAGFADAGITFFHALPAVWNLDVADRRELGGNGEVSRVLVSNQRILLETSRIVVRFLPDAFEKREEVLKRHRLIEIPTSALPPDVTRAATTTGLAVDVCLELMKEDSIVYAEPDFIEHIGERYTPTDPDFAKQWHHKILKAEEAWNDSTGQGIKIAVIDHGFDTTHKDLKFGPLSGWYRKAGLADADFVPGTARMLNINHGTACAGMIAAREGNKLGGCGVAFGAELSMIACIPVDSQTTLARAVGYAANPAREKQEQGGADIISCSLGPPKAAQWDIQQVLADAIDHAATQGRGGKGCAIFWACTNGNHPIGSDQVCSHPRVMAVGRSTREDKDDASGFGPELEFLAPGVNVWIPGSGAYKSATGTSYAAPCAAAVGALALAKHPAMAAEELRQLMRETCDQVGDLPYIEGRNIRFGHGRLNATAAVSRAVAMAPSTPTS